MGNKRLILFPILLVGLAVFGTVSFSSPAYAVDPPSTTLHAPVDPALTRVVPGESFASYRDRVGPLIHVTDSAACAAQGVYDCTETILGSWYYLGGIEGLTNVSGLPACQQGHVQVNDGVNAEWLCGMRATSAGITPWEGAHYEQGDTVKCYEGLGGGFTGFAYREHCAVTRANGSVHYSDSAIGRGTAETSPTGEVTGGQGGQSATGAALSQIGRDILRAVATAILAIANFFLGIAGVLFNLLVVRTIFQFGSVIGNSPGVLIAWGILRDIANMALLFGFIFMGIATILNTNGLQNYTARQALPRLLIFAILMNFSLFAAEAIIDSANAISSVMYAQANTSNTNCAGVTGTGSATPEGGCTTTGPDWNYGIAGRIMSSTGLSTMWSAPGVGGDPINEVVTLIGLAVFATVGAIVLFSACIMFVIRLVVLTFLMVVSPIGFAGMALPPLQKFASDWWTRLIHQAFYAPILLLLIFISLKIADTFSSVNGSNGGLATGLGAAVSSPSASTVDIIVVFALVIGFLVASIMIANKFGATGASFAVGFSRKLVLGTYGQIGGFAGRKTIGAAGNWAQKKYQSAAGRSGLLRSIALNTGLDEGIMSLTDKAKNAKFGGTKSFADKQKRDKERNAELDKVKQVSNVKSASKSGDEPKLVEALKKLSDTEIIESDLLKGSKELLADISNNLSAERFDKLLSNDKLSDAKKGEMRTARYQELGKAAAGVNEAKAKYAANPTSSNETDYNNKKKELAKMANSLSDKDFGQFVQSSHSGILGDEEFVASLSDDSFKDKRKNNSLTSAQGAVFDTARNKVLTDPAIIASRISTMSADEITKNIKSDALSKQAVLSKISGRKLALIDLNKIADDAHVKAIVTYIKNNVLTDPARAADFRTQLIADPRIAKKWSAYRIV